MKNCTVLLYEKPKFLHAFSAYSRQLRARELLQYPPPAERRVHHDAAGIVRRDRADDRGFAACVHALQRREGARLILRRDDREKLFLSLDELDTKVPKLLDAVQKSLYEKAKANMEEHTYPAYSLEEAKKIQEEKGGFIKTMWCGELACEMKMKEQAGMSSRCMPLHQEHLADTCPICGKPAKHMIYWGVAY